MQLASHSTKERLKLLDNLDTYGSIYVYVNQWGFASQIVNRPIFHSAHDISYSQCKGMENGWEELSAAELSSVTQRYGPSDQDWMLGMKTSSLPSSLLTSTSYRKHLR